MWRSQYNLPEGPLDDKYIDILLDALGMSNYMDEECQLSDHPFDNSVDQWVNGKYMSYVSAERET